MEQSAETIFGCCASQPSLVKFMFSKKATKVDEIFNIDLTTVKVQSVDLTCDVIKKVALFVLSKL